MDFVRSTVQPETTHLALRAHDQIEIVHQILLQAIEMGASDIHFEPYDKSYRIRHRLDGLLSEMASPPKNLAPRIAARLKILANLDTAERRLPQDGRFTMLSAEGNPLDLRVSTCPTTWGEKIVVRLLDKKSTQRGIDTLGLEPSQERVFLDTLQKPQGLILVTGPTGSGKTVTLYAALNHLNQISRNISTAEDPVEINLEGINQVNINPKAGLDFATLLKAFLRQDPDVMMIGEIRDQETAEIAIKASLTGHLVLSTLHTNSAAETITRLLDLNIPAFNIVAALRLVIAQRLVRQLCSSCKQVDSNNNYQPQGCQHCHQGYKGRIGLFELMTLSKPLSHLIRSSAPPSTLLEQAQQEGMSTLYQAGLSKIKQGLTTIDEVNRVAVV